MQAHLERDLVDAGVSLEAVAVARQTDGRPLDAAMNRVNMFPGRNLLCSDWSLKAELD